MQTHIHRTFDVAADGILRVIEYYGFILHSQQLPRITITPLIAERQIAFTASIPRCFVQWVSQIYLTIKSVSRTECKNN